MRLDTFAGALDVSFVPLAATDAEVASQGAFAREEIEAGLHAAGFNAPNKIYAAYYDGSSTWSCGGSAWPPVIVGNVGAIYLKGTPPGSPPCSANTFAGAGEAPRYFEFGMLHELMHTLGFVAACAPHHTRRPRLRRSARSDVGG
jgi:hypothetical protein